MDKRDWEFWVHKVGLKLDGIIPLQGMTNHQRIEMAINEYVQMKRASHTADAKELCFDCEIYKQYCARCTRESGQPLRR